MDGLNNIQRELEQAREQQRLNIPAKRIIEKIQGIPSDVEKLQRRWFWELLQNASDYNDEVRVELELFPDKVVFKHDGLPFRPIDTENLIAPDSGKDDQETRTDDMIGQFGTGFISTHVLSSTITIEGIIKSEHTERTFHKFKFNLDRSGFDDKEQLKTSITNSSNELNSNVQPTEYDRGRFDTIFTYHLDNNLPGINKGQAVAPGLEYIYQVLPYTLAFMPKIKSVGITNYNTEFVEFYQQSYTSRGDRNVFEVEIRTTKERSYGYRNEIRKFQLKNVGESNVIVEIDSNTILQYPENLTRLFCALPMIGTENFASPIAINSQKFKPKTERDGIKLSKNDEVNRDILLSASSAYKKLIDDLVSKEYLGIYNIVRWTDFQGENDEKSWFGNNILNPLKSHLLSSKIVKTSISRIELGEVCIPYFNQEDLKKGQLKEFYTLCEAFMPSKVPIETDFIHWFNNLDFKVFTKCKYELKELLDEVSNLGTMDALGQRVDDPTTWLIKLIKIVLVIDGNLLDQYKIIPNQLGSFVLRKDDVHYDDDLSDDLIAIYDVLHENEYRSYLLMKSFESIADLLPSARIKTEEMLTKAIDDAFSSTEESMRSGAKFQSGLKLMFKWLAECGKSEREIKDLFKWFSQKKPQLFLETIPDYDREKILSVAQSGKLSSLSRLAYANITSEELEVISTNVEGVVKLSKVLENVDGGMSILLQYAELIRKDDEDFKFKKEIGEKVERVFKEALLSSELIDPKISIEHDGLGAHDFEITNTTNGKKFYIELKSYRNHANDHFKLAPSQAKFGAQHGENYCVATVQRPNSLELVTESFIRNNLSARVDIGQLVTKGLADYEQFNKISNNGNLHLTLRDDIRININSMELNIDGMSFDQLIEVIKMKLL